MKIFWPRILQLDIVLDVVTWEAMARALIQQENDVKIFISGKDHENRFDGIGIHVPIIRKRFLRTLSYFIFGYIYFNYHFIKKKPDVVICNIFSFIFTFPFGLIFGNKFRTKFILDNRTLYFGGSENINSTFNYIRTKLAFKYTKRFFHGTTAIVPFLQNQISSMSGIQQKKIGVWSSGVDINHFSPDRRRQRQQWKWMEGKFIVLQHGYMGYNRGILESIEAFKYIDEPNIHLVLAGKGPAEKEIQEKISSLQLTNQISFLGQLTYQEIPDLIEHADTAIMAYPKTDYWRGNNPLKLLEYMAMEKIIICTDMSTFRHVLGASKGCIYIKDNNPELISKALVECYQQKETLQSGSTLHRKIVMERYTWSQQARSLVNYIESL